MNKSRQKQNIKALNALFEAFVVLKNKRECQRFVNDLCTPAEIRAMADRWEVVQRLVTEEDSYRKIYEETGVSITTVGRVARFLHTGYGGYQLVLKRLKRT